MFAIDLQRRAPRDQHECKRGQPCRPNHGGEREQEEATDQERPEDEVQKLGIGSRLGIFPAVVHQPPDRAQHERKVLIVLLGPEPDEVEVHQRCKADQQAGKHCVSAVLCMGMGSNSAGSRCLWRLRQQAFGSSPGRSVPTECNRTVSKEMP